LQPRKAPTEFTGGMMPLKVKSSTRGPGVVAVSPIGSIDASTYGILEEMMDKVLSQNPDVIIFDMEFADYISSTGIRVLLKTKKALKETNGRMVFMKLQPQIRKVFDILKAIPSLKVFANIEELDNYLDTMQKAAKK
jgi:anti-anti-sigma factor